MKPNEEKLKNLKNLKIPYKFDSRYVFKDSLIRIVRLINEAKSLEDIVKSTKLPYIFTKDDSPINFEYTVKEFSSFDSYSEIVWILTNKNIPSPIKLSFNLTENTVDNTVLLVFELSVENRELVPDEYKYKIITLFEGIAVDIIKKMILKLKKDNNDIYHYQSKILNYSRDKVFSLITHIYEIMKEKGIVSNVKIDGEINKEGTILDFIFLFPPKEIRIKIGKFKVKENDAKWTLNYIPLDASFSDSLIQIILIKLDDEQTLVTYTNKYIEQIEPSILKSLTERKIHMFEIVEEELNKRYK